jgi:hypothetical protein
MASIPRAINQNTGGVAFGSGVRLHMVLVWIGYAMGITVVPDNLDRRNAHR